MERPQEFQVAASFAFPFEADLAQLRLEVEGIRSRLADVALVGWFWHFSNAVGGVKLLVMTEDLRAARQILGDVQAALAGPADSENGSLATRKLIRSAPCEDETEAEDWVCPKCKETVPADWDVCWACGTTTEGTDTLESTGAEPVESEAEEARDDEGETLNGNADPTRASTPPAGSLPSPPHVPRRWVCGRCGARVAEELFTCWACGTTADGEIDTHFEVADAPIREYDPHRTPPVWWAVICLVVPPLWIYELLIQGFPSRAEQRAKRRATFFPSNPLLVRACRLAVFGVGWFPPFSLVSLWLLRKVSLEDDMQWPGPRVIFRVALALNLLFSVPCMLLLLLAVFQLGLANQ